MVYRPTYTMSQETHNSDTVSTAQIAENHDQTDEKTTIMADQSTLTFEGQNAIENSTNEQASFGDYDSEMGQETIPPHCQTQARPVLDEQPKTLTPPKSAQESNPESTKQTGNSRKMRRITSVRHPDDEDFIAQKARNQSRKIVENDKKSTDQSDETENDKNIFHKERLSPHRVKPRATRKKHGEMSTTNRHGVGTLSHSLKIHPGPKTTKSTND